MSSSDGNNGFSPSSPLTRRFAEIDLVGVGVRKAVTESDFEIVARLRETLILAPTSRRKVIINSCLVALYPSLEREGRYGSRALRPIAKGAEYHPLGHLDPSKPAVSLKGGYSQRASRIRFKSPPPTDEPSSSSGNGEFRASRGNCLRANRPGRDTFSDRLVRCRYFDSGVNYNWAPWTTSGGVPPYTYSLASGPLPPGFQLNSSSGNVYGSSSSQGLYPVTIKVTDSTSATATASTDLQILAPVSITTSSLPAGVYGAAYTASLQASGGWPSGTGSTYSYVWGTVSGAFPPGLTLNTSTGAITGAPTAIGTFSVTISAADGDMSVSRMFSITVTGTTIETSPEGLQFTVDGGPLLTAPQDLGLSQGSHTIAVGSPQPGGGGIQYVFTSWSDSGAASHMINVGSTSNTYIAGFKTQYQLTLSASPPSGGLLTLGPRRARLGGRCRELSWKFANLLPVLRRDPCAQI